MNYLFLVVGIFLLLLISFFAIKFLNTTLLSALNTFVATFREELRQNRQELGSSFHHMREELQSQNSQNREDYRKNIADFSVTTENRLRIMTDTLDRKLADLQLQNAQKLEEMRVTVDEKLQKTLNERLVQSFKQVQDKLEAVHIGLGKMESLATGVGDLKKVLSNVKTTGILGEFQLGNILEQILSPQQYVRDIATKKNSTERVEFAVRLPGKDNAGDPIYLPIDAKFPIISYEKLLLAYDSGHVENIRDISKELERTIKKFAKDIRDKYIDVPHTTDFGIMFLPIEGLYAEIVRQPGLVEILQRDLRVIVTGPSTLAALLNSLNMGFQTLAFEKRSQEIREILSAVKSEFNKFGDVLGKVQKNLSGASQELDTLIGTRTNKIQLKLRGLDELPEGYSAKLLGIEEV